MSVTDNKKISQDSKDINDAINNNTSNIPANSNKNKFLIRDYNNQQIRRISEFEFLIEKQDIVVGKKEIIEGEYEQKQKYKQQFRMRVPVRIFANDLLFSHMLSDRTLGQAMNVSTIPRIIKHVVVLPDGHEGYGFPVGCVAATDLEEEKGEYEGRQEIGGVISPGGVGYDINCGVRLIRTNLLENDIESKLKQLVNELFDSIPSGLGSKGRIELTKSEFDKV